MVKQLLNKRNSQQEEEIQSENNISHGSPKPKGDSVEVDKCNEELLKLELTDKKEHKAMILKEVGSGDR